MRLRHYLLNILLASLMSVIGAVSGLRIGGCPVDRVAYINPGPIEAEHSQDGDTHVIVIVGDVVITCEVPRGEG